MSKLRVFSPSYNSHKFCISCIDSVASQTQLPNEHFFIDDEKIGLVIFKKQDNRKRRSRNTSLVTISQMQKSNILVMTPNGTNWYKPSKLSKA